MAADKCPVHANVHAFRVSCHVLAHDIALLMFRGPIKGFQMIVPYVLPAAACGVLLISCPMQRTANMEWSRHQGKHPRPLIQTSSRDGKAAWMVSTSVEARCLVTVYRLIVGSAPGCVVVSPSSHPPYPPACNVYLAHDYMQRLSCSLVTSGNHTDTNPTADLAAVPDVRFYHAQMAIANGFDGTRPRRPGRRRCGASRTAAEAVWLTVRATAYAKLLFVTLQ